LLDIYKINYREQQKLINATLPHNKQIQSDAAKAAPLMRGVRHSMNRLVYSFAILVFSVFLTIHVITYLDYDIVFISNYTLPLIVTAIVSGAMSMLWYKTKMPRAESFIKSGEKYAPTLLLGMFFPLVPYLAMNFFLSVALLEGGSPERIGEIYYFMKEGVRIRELDYAAYNQLIAYQTRLFSGYWLAIGWLSLLSAKIVKTKGAQHA
jgi:hypothetical protein